MTKLEKKVRERERKAIEAINRSVDNYQDIYQSALRVLFDLVLLLIGVVIGFYLSETRAHASTTASIPPRAEYVGPITEAAPERLPEAVNEVPVATMPDAEQVERVGEEHWEYLGRWKTTGYCSCRKCNGRNAGRTASGAPMIPGRTIATGRLPFGTELMVDGVRYVVEDRGVPYGHIDILYGDHRTASNHGVQYREVWIKR